MLILRMYSINSCYKYLSRVLFHITLMTMKVHLCFFAGQDNKEGVSEVFACISQLANVLSGSALTVQSRIS